MPLLRRAPRQCLLNNPLSSAHTQLVSSQRHAFSTCPPLQMQTRLREKMWAWFRGPGQNFKEPRLDGSNYLSAYNQFGQLMRDRTQEQPSEVPSKRQSGTEDPEGQQEEADDSKPAERADAEAPVRSVSDEKPFPLNQAFVSHPVLSEELREEIWRRVQVAGKDVREVSQALNVDMSRVAAVVRLKEIEKRWVREKKPLAGPYARAMSTMLPQTPFDRSKKDDRFRPVHEDINPLPVHASTKKQLFVPTSESRIFTRADAARAFSNSLLPAEARIPHPDMVAHAWRRLAGRGGSLVDEKYFNRWQRALKRAQAARDAKAARERAKKDDAQVVSGARWDFRIENVDTEEATLRDPAVGEKRPGVGWRYGVPLDDRKKGRVKIPTSVEA